MNVPQDADQGPARNLGMGVGLREEPGDDPRAEFPAPGVRDLLAGQQPQEVRLPRPVRAEYRNPLPVEDL